jgi:hypothetical protein
VQTAATRAQGERGADARAHAHGHVLMGERGERLQVPPPPAQGGARAHAGGRSGAHG